MAVREIINRERVASLFAISGMTAIIVLASLGQPVLGGLLVAFVVGYVSGRSVSDAGRSVMYRNSNILVGAWMTCLLLIAWLAVEYLGFTGAARDVSRLQSFAYGVPALLVVGFVHGAWHEHLERSQGGVSPPCYRICSARTSGSSS